MATTDRTWIASAFMRWQAERRVDVEAGLALDYTFGAALNSGQIGVSFAPSDPLTVGLRFTAFQQLEEFRIAEGRVWSIGGDLSWRTRMGTLWGSLDRYRHDDRGDATALDWTQTRAELGWALYLGPEPGMEF